MRYICLLAFLPVAFCSAFASDALSPIKIDGASRDEVKNDLVLRLMHDGRYRLVQDTSFQMAFERDADQPPIAKQPYQSGPPLDRFVYTVATSAQGVEVTAKVIRIIDSGNPLERHLSIDKGEAVDEANQVILSLRAEIEGKKPVSMKARQGVAFQYVHIKRHVQYLATVKHSIFTPSKTIGFSAQSPSLEASGRGLVITSVDPKTPAARAGLRAADRIVSVDGQPINDAQDMQSMSMRVAGKKHGAIAVIRDGKMVEAHLDM